MFLQSFPHQTNILWAGLVKDEPWKPTGCYVALSNLAHFSPHSQILDQVGIAGEIYRSADQGVK